MKKSLLIGALVLIVGIGVFTYAALEQEVVIIDDGGGGGGGGGGYNSVINGSCGSSKYSCSPGDMEKEKESSTNYRWICKGSGGGRSVACTLSKSSEVQTLFNRVKTWISNAVKTFEPYKKTDNRDANLTDEEKLTMDQWNNIMDYLDGLVPAGAIMAFALDKCPTGWTRFEAADGKFLMGANSDIGGIGGDNLIRLSQAQLPSHGHYMVSKTKIESKDYVYDQNGMTYAKDKPLSFEHDHDETGSEANYSYTLMGSPGKAEVGLTSKVGNGELIDITNAHVRVLYCVKISNSDSSNSNPTPGGNLPRDR